MHRFRRPIEIAFRALLLAIGLPIVVFMFGAIRSRQLTSTANPRWAQFAKGPIASTKSHADETAGQNPIRTASLHSDETAVSKQLHGHDLDSSFTGSVSGHSSIELPVHSEPFSPAVSEGRRVTSRRDVLDRQSIVVRPTDDEHDLIVQSALRLELQLSEIRQRLDQLVQLHRDRQADDVLRESQLLDALTRFHNLTKTETETAIENLKRNALTGVARGLVESPEEEDEESLFENLPKFISTEPSSSDDMISH